MNQFGDKARNAGRSVKKFFIRLGFVVLALLIAAALFAYFVPFGTGTRAGVVMKLSHRGVVFKTYEGQLDIKSFGGIRDAENMMTEVFEFSVKRSDKEVIEELENVSLTGERVNLRYVEKYVLIPWMGETKYFIVDVERMGEAKPADNTRSFPRTN